MFWSRYAERLVLDAKRAYFTVNFHHKHDADNFEGVIQGLNERGYEVDQYKEVPQTDNQGLNTVVVAVQTGEDEDASYTRTRVAADEATDAEEEQAGAAGSEPKAADLEAGVARPARAAASRHQGCLSVEQLKGIAKLRRAKAAAGGEESWARMPPTVQRVALEKATVGSAAYVHKQSASLTVAR